MVTFRLQITLAILVLSVTAARALNCSFVAIDNEYPWPGYSLWLNFDFGGQITPFTTTPEEAARLIARLEFVYSANGQIYVPSASQWSTQSISDSRDVVVTDTGFRVFDPVFSLGNWSVSVKSTANDASLLYYRFLLNGETLEQGLRCNFSLPPGVRLLASVDGLLSFSAPVRKCSGAALTASDLSGWNCTGTLQLVDTGESGPAGYSRLWRCTGLVNDSSLVVPVASAICDQYGAQVSLFFNGPTLGDPLGSEPFVASDVNSAPGLFETFWFVDPVFRNISRILTRARNVFNDSASVTVDTFGFSFDQWLAHSAPVGFSSNASSGTTTVSLNVSVSAAVSVATTTSAPRTQVRKFRESIGNKTNLFYKT